MGRAPSCLGCLPRPSRAHREAIAAEGRNTTAVRARIQRIFLVSRIGWCSCTDPARHVGSRASSPRRDQAPSSIRRRPLRRVTLAHVHAADDAVGGETSGAPSSSLEDEQRLPPRPATLSTSTGSDYRHGRGDARCPRRDRGGAGSSRHRGGLAAARARFSRTRSPDVGTSTGLESGVSVRKRWSPSRAHVRMGDEPQRRPGSRAPRPLSRRARRRAGPAPPRASPMRHELRSRS